MQIGHEHAEGLLGNSHRKQSIRIMWRQVLNDLNFNVFERVVLFSGFNLATCYSFLESVLFFSKSHFNVSRFTCFSEIPG